MSWGVVMDTRHLTRVSGTVLSSLERTRLRLMRYWLVSSPGVVNTLSGPKPSIDVVMLSAEREGEQTGALSQGLKASSHEHYHRSVSTGLNVLAQGHLSTGLNAYRKTMQRTSHKHHH